MFLPGILLRELTLWLAAGILRARAEGALQFPNEQDISVLRLSFIRLAPDTGTFKLILISLSPLASGLAALWAISAPLIPGGEPLTLALPSSATELGAAITSFVHAANFWLWLYVVFTIANRCFPALPMRLSARRKIVLMLALLALCFGLWRASDAANPAIALGIEGLLNGLTLIIAQITLLNSGCVLALGAIEAVIERISSRSASFRDGRMITRDSGETAPPQTSQMPERRKAAKGSLARQSAPATSIYDLKLPIPGPPGREPVSRQAVTLVNLDPAGAAEKPASQTLASRPNSIPTVLDEEVDSAREIKNLISDESLGVPTNADAPVGQEEPQHRDTAGSGKSAAGESRLADADHAAVAPFARPFTERDAPGSAVDAWDEALDESGGEPFTRPFVMPARSDQPASAADAPGAESDRAKFHATVIDADDANKEKPTVPGESRRGASRPRPAPKPSQSDERETRRAEPLEPEELVYEDLDEIDAYDLDDGTYDDES